MTDISGLSCDAYELMYSPHKLSIVPIKREDYDDLEEYVSNGWVYSGGAEFYRACFGLEKAKDTMRDKIREQIDMMTKFANNNNIHLGT